MASLSRRKVNLISGPCDGVSGQAPGPSHCTPAWARVTDDSAFAGGGSEESKGQGDF